MAVYLLLLTTNWPMLKVWNIRGEEKFGDLSLVMKWISDCEKNSFPFVFITREKCGNYIYGDTLRYILKALHLDRLNAKYLVGFLVVVLIGSLWFVAKESTPKLHKLIWPALLITPPFFLLSERANFDILIIGLLCISISLFSRDHDYLGFTAVAIATLAKFYTLPLLAFLVFYKRKNIAFKCIVFVFIAIETAIEITRINSQVPAGFQVMFGVRVWSEYTESVSKIDAPLLVVDFLVNLSGLVFAIYLLRRNKIVYQPSILSGTKEVNIFIFFFIVHASCFFAGMNYDYRLVLLGIASLTYLRINPAKAPKREEATIIVLVTISQWFTFPIRELQPVGDFAVGILTFYLGIRLLQLLSSRFNEWSNYVFGLR